MNKEEDTEFITQRKENDEKVGNVKYEGKKGRKQPHGSRRGRKPSQSKAKGTPTIIREFEKKVGLTFQREKPIIVQRK